MNLYISFSELLIETLVNNSSLLDKENIELKFLNINVLYLKSGFLV